jgi:hypothetical protein
VKPEGGERIRFKYRPQKLQVRLDEEEASLETISEGKSVVVDFHKATAARKSVEQDLARSVTIRSESLSDSGCSGSAATGTAPGGVPLQ